MATVALHCPRCHARAGWLEADGDGWFRLVRHERWRLTPRRPRREGEEALEQLGRRWRLVFGVDRAHVETRDRVDRFIIPRPGGGFGPSIDGENWSCPRCRGLVTVAEAHALAALKRARHRGRVGRLALDHGPG